MPLLYPDYYVAFSRGYTGNTKGYHGGVDLAWNNAHGGKNVDLYAPADGKVVALVNKYNDGYNPDAGYGNYIIIEHNIDGRTIYTLLGHMLRNSFTVTKGQTVKQMQKVGRMGCSGYSMGNHCHFEVRLDENTSLARVDPAKWVYATDKHFVHAGTQLTYNILHYDPILPISSDPIYLKVGFASDGDLKRFKNLCEELFIGYREDNGYLYTEVAVSSGDQLKFVALSKETSVPVVQYTAQPDMSDEYQKLLEECEALELENSQLRQKLIAISEICDKAI